MWPVGELPCTNLWTLEVYQNGNGFAEVTRCLPDIGVNRFVNRVCSMAQVHSSNIDPGFKYRLYRVV
ncbi:unannotated protein [freshwater metagenome]|uniref:Unannotated protein n=1 Tax=freshwater metagenome TaxID=449393 RepID=A0A6J6G145_9ZZZZ